MHGSRPLPKGSCLAPRSQEERTGGQWTFVQQVSGTLASALVPSQGNLSQILPVGEREGTIPNSFNEVALPCSN
jgi:hypothetical protein